MANYKVFKETALPGTLEANSIYLIAPAAKPNYVEMYVTGTVATTVKRIVNTDDIQAMIDAALAGFSAVTVVDTIAQRDALVLDANAIVLVTDATGDATVAAGAATYAYRFSNTSWTKISEYESLDVQLTWANLQNKPTSSVTDIDDAVSKRHQHANMTELNKIGEDGDGNLTYNGALPATAWGSTSW